MGKWTKLKKSKKFKKFENPPEWQEKIDEYKKEVIGDSPGGDGNQAYFANLLAGHKIEKRDLEANIKKLNVKIEGMNQILVDSLEDNEVNKIEISSGASFSIKDEPYVTVKDLKKFFAWLKEKKKAYLLTYKWNTLNAEVKGELEKGNTKPPPGCEVFIKTTISVRGLPGGDKDKEESDD